MSKEDQKYVNAPLSIFKDFHENPVDTLAKFFNVGIYRFAAAMKFRTEDVLRSVLYAFNNNKLSNNVTAAIQEIADINDICTTEFGEWDYDHDNAIEILLPYFETLDVFNSCVIFHQLESAKKLLGLSFYNDNVSKVQSEFAKEEINFILKFGKDANVSLNTKMLLDFILKPKSKSEFDLLAAFIAVKSIQGNKQFCKTNKAFLLMRMLGAKSNQVLASNLKIKANKDFHAKYSKRYNMDTIIDGLVKKGFILSKIGMSRSVYLSTQLSFDLLPIAIAESENTKNFKTNERDARQRLKEALQQLK